MSPIAGYELTLDGLPERQGPNYREQIAQFTVIRDGRVVGTIVAIKRNFAARQTATSEAALMTRGVSQLYVSLGDSAADGAIGVRHLSQADGAADLARRGGDDVRRIAVAARTAACASARRDVEGHDHGAEGSAARRPPNEARACCAVCRMAGRGRCACACGTARRSAVQCRRRKRRARALSRELRCMVCQNQSIDDSDAPLARDLRLLVRERIAAGDSDAQVLDFLVARYGQFVLLKPRIGGVTLLLWLVPPLVLAGGGLALWFAVRRRRADSAIRRAAVDARRNRPAFMKRSATTRNSRSK